MNKDTKILTLITVVLVSSILAVFMSAYVINLQQFQNFLPFSRQPQFQPQITFAEIQLINIVKLIFSTINIVLLTVLVLNYVSIYLKTRSGFTVGLLIFAIAFLIKDIAANPMLAGNRILFPGVGEFALLFFILPDFLELVALLVLVYLSIK
jgi:uncharacterized membrane protein (UPF0182 family)